MKGGERRKKAMNKKQKEIKYRMKKIADKILKKMQVGEIKKQSKTK